MAASTLYFVLLAARLPGAPGLLHEGDEGADLVFVPATPPYEDDPDYPEAEPEAPANLTTSDGYSFATNPPGVESWMPIKGPRGGEGWRDRLLIVPALKFAFCWIDKNAGTQFNNLMNALNDGHFPHGRTGCWWASNPSAFDMTFEEATKKDGWRFGVFLRDPAERLLSAWASKCVDWEDRGRNCMGREHIYKGKQEQPAFESMVQEKLTRYGEHVLEDGWWNSHFDPQTFFCGGREISEYDFVGRLTGDRRAVGEQVRDMLRRVAQAPQDSKVWHAADMLFPLDGVHGHHTNSSSRMARFYQKPEVYRKVQDFYRTDYEHLGFKPGHYVKK